MYKHEIEAAILTRTPLVATVLSDHPFTTARNITVMPIRYLGRRKVRVTWTQTAQDGSECVLTYEVHQSRLKPASQHRADERLAEIHNHVHFLWGKFTLLAKPSVQHKELLTTSQLWSIYVQAHAALETAREYHRSQMYDSLAVVAKTVDALYDEALSLFPAVQEVSQ